MKSVVQQLAANTVQLASVAHNGASVARRHYIVKRAAKLRMVHAQPSHLQTHPRHPIHLQQLLAMLAVLQLAVLLATTNAAHSSASVVSLINIAASAASLRTACVVLSQHDPQSHHHQCLPYHQHPPLQL